MRKQLLNKVPFFFLLFSDFHRVLSPSPQSMAPKFDALACVLQPAQFPAAAGT